MIVIIICICIFIFIKKKKTTNETEKDQDLLGTYSISTPLETEEVPSDDGQKLELSEANSKPKTINKSRISIEPEQPAPLPY